MTHTITIESPYCESTAGVCAYLDNATGECWGVEGSAEMGAGVQTVDYGQGMIPRYGRHVECPFGTACVVWTGRKTKKGEGEG